MLRHPSQTAWFDRQNGEVRPDRENGPRKPDTQDR